jgi:predicted membrane-bound spermidine synthase
MPKPRPLRPNAFTSPRLPASPPSRLPERPRLAASSAALGAAGLILEIALTRLFSVLLFYHYVFLVLAVALLGLGLGGALAALLPDRATRGQEYAAGAAGLAALTTIAATVVSARWLPSSMPLLHGAVALIPFLFVGIAMPLLLSARPAAAGTIYGADLAGAALGALAAFGLLYLGPIVAAFGAAMLFALAALLLQPRRSTRRGSAALLGLVALVFVVGAVAQPIDVNLARLAGGKPLNLWLGQAKAKTERSAWDPFARTDVVYKPDDPQERLVFLDGAAGSSLPHYPSDGNEEMRRRTELGFFPYRLFGPKRVLVIGSGGGLGVLHALLAGVGDITAVEVSPGAVNAVRADGDYDGYLYDRSEVRVVVDEGRSFLRRDEGTYDLIDLSLVVSLATAQSGYALTENYLFTVEAFDDALAHLNDDGLIAVRLYDDPTLTRAFLTAATTMRRHEPTDAAAVSHLAVLFNPSEATKNSPAFYPLLLVSKQPFTSDTAQQLVDKANIANYDVIYAPFAKEDGPFGKVARGEASLTSIRGELTGGVFTPATDAKPFFFEMTGHLPRPLVEAWIAVAAVVLGLGAASALSRRSSGQPLLPDAATARGLAYFAVLGAGFMVVELILLARLTLVLGHPVVALATVLAGLLLAGGAGSLASHRLEFERRPRAIGFAAAVVALLSLLLIPVTGHVPHAILTLPTPARVLVVLLVLAPLGAAMGTLLPSGLRLFPGDATLPWAINGVGSIVGSVLATTLALKFGYPVAAVAAAILYGTLALAGPALLGRPVWFPRSARVPEPAAAGAISISTAGLGKRGDR